MNKIIACSLLLLLLASCGGEDSPTTPMPELVATSVTLSATSLSFASLGETTQLSATANDQNGAGGLLPSE